MSYLFALALLGVRLRTTVPSYYLYIWYPVVMSDRMDPDQLRLRSSKIPTKEHHRTPRHKPGELFLKGPIPWNWLSIAASLPGKALHVALAIWFLTGVKKSPRVSLSGKVLRSLGVKRHSAYRGLKRLEDAHLVKAVRHSGRSPIVTLIDVPTKDESAD